MLGLSLGRAKRSGASSRRLSIDSLETRDVPSGNNLGSATDFNLLAFNNINVSNSDVQGRVAVGNDATIKAYGIGDYLTNSNGTRDDLIVGHNLNYQYGQVFNGNVVYGNAGVLDGVGIPHGTKRKQANVVNFAGYNTDLTAKSDLWGAEAPNGFTGKFRGNIVMRGTHPTLDFFTLTNAQLNGAYGITLRAPSTATIVINVPDTVVNINSLGFNLRGGVTGDRILWNFPNATTVNVSGVGLEGSFLAPRADFNFNNGQITGTVIANNFSGNGQLHLAQSNINIVIPDFASLKGFVFVDSDRNHVFNPAIDSPLEGTTVQLTGRDSLGRRVNRTFFTSGGGVFDYTKLWPGSYSIRVVPPFKYVNSAELGIPGLVNGSASGTPDVNRVRSITLGAGSSGVNYQLPLVDPFN